MKVTTGILKKILDIDISNEELARLAKEHIGNVEYTHDMENDYEGIIVAEIVEKKEHPDAEKLGVYQIDIGEGERIQVVAGDKSLEIGDKVAYIPPRYSVPITIYTESEPVKIKSVKLRGVLSNGMLCSEKELNIGANHDHVLKLPADAPVGTSFAKYYGLDDYIIDIENKALTNRGDLFGVVGIARELSVAMGKKFKSPEWYTNKTITATPKESCLNLSVVNDAEALCPRYIAIAMDNIEVKESPLWLKSELIRLDIKPINNIIDITNYISAMFAQPLHAFDYDKIAKANPSRSDKVEIHVRMGRDNEEIVGLDNKVHKLNDRVIVIADSMHPLAIAGVIGGKDTSVDSNTKRIIFESAIFDKNSIRRASMALGIYTEASTKYKHSLDTETSLPAILKAIELTKELANGTVASEVIDVYTTPYTEKVVTVDTERLNRHIGTDLSKEEIEKILENLEYIITSSEGKFMTVQVPSWRRDVTIPEDIHEDIARIHGYANTNIVLPKKEISARKSNHIFEFKKEIRSTLSSLGLNEILTYSFTGLQNFEKCNLNPDLAYKIKNALSPELSIMRTTLLQSILEKMKNNIDRGFEEFGLFEINIPHVNTYVDDASLPKEDWHLASVINTNRESDSSPYYLAKRYVERVLDISNCKREYILMAESLEQNIPEDIKPMLTMFDANVTAFIVVEKEIVGILGELKQSLKETFKLGDYSCAFDINLNRLLDIKDTKHTFKDVPIYPSYSLDFCFNTARDTRCGDIEERIRNVINKQDLWGKVECIDIYASKDDPTRKKITFRVKGSNYKKTLDDKEIKDISEKVKNTIEKEFDAKLE